VVSDEGRGRFFIAHLNPSHAQHGHLSQCLVDQSVVVIVVDPVPNGHDLLIHEPTHNLYQHPVLFRQEWR